MPEIGQFYAFKKLQLGIIAVLLVPKSAKRLNTPVSRKCRVSKAKVVKMYDPQGGNYTQPIGGLHNPEFKYQVGKWITPDSFNEDIREVCTNGIHCFITEKEARE